MSDKIIACKDCKFFKRAFKGVCTKLTGGYTDYVNGKRVKTKIYKDPYQMRTDPYCCSSSAKWFKPKGPSFFTRLFGRM